MHITTVHTLMFTIKTNGTEQSNAALTIIKAGAATLHLTATVSATPLLEGDDTAMRNYMIQACSEEHDVCIHYWGEVARALALIGVDAVSP
jgi:hypothetical protein